MSLVSPVPQSTVIKLYKGVAWDSSLSDVRLFDSTADRDAYLGARLAGTWENCSVVSVGKSIRVQALYNNCIDCNYLSFTNGNMGDTQRTYYAFVTSVDYVNAQTVQLSYQIDWIQTYLFDYVFESTFVEREHVNDDTFGKNVLDERLETGEYVIQGKTEATFGSAVVMNVLPDEYTSSSVGNMYQAGQTTVVPLGSLGDLESLLEEYNTKPERITYFGMGAAPMAVGEGGGLFTQIMTTNPSSGFAGGGSAGTYSPQNKKTLCYPYRLAILDNFNGSETQLRYELAFSGGQANETTFSLQIQGTAYPKPVMYCSPANYRGSELKESQECVVYDNFPMVPYATDAFRAWVSEFGASKVASRAAEVSLTSLGMAANALSFEFGAAVEGLGTLAQNMISDYQDYKSHQLHSVQVHGGVTESGLHFATGEVGFRVTNYAIKADRAKEIDDYFTRFGYRVDIVKIPNVRGRAVVNYVKCAIGRVSGNLATDAKLQMERALQQGVSFWHTNDIGSQVSSNPIVA